jgi:hypothetical protein
MSDTLEFDPLEIVRYCKGPSVFGLKPSSLAAKIAAGDIPAPIPLSENGTALGWTRQTIADHHARMAALAAERRAAAALLPKEKGIKPPALVLANAKKAAKTKKLKLRPPAGQHRSRAD